MRQISTGIAALLIGSAGMAQAQMACDGLTPEAFNLTGVRFTDVMAVPAGEESPVAQCRIHGITAERKGVDGRDYALRFELALPDNWNGNYVHQFNGGNDGAVVPATGALGAGTGETAPLARGYAVVSSDAGHDGSAVTDAGLAGGARFGFDFEARRMYGYGAVATLDPIARQIVEGFYGAPIGLAYGIGCSNGGRHAMVAAARMPEAFDGILAGAPGYDLPRTGLQHALDIQQMSRVNMDLAKSFSREDLNLVSDGIKTACDGLDGLEDGLVMDSAACQATFDIGSLTCKPGQNTACLSETQVDALRIMHAGAPDGQEPYYSDWLWDTGISNNNWRFWKVESPIPPWGGNPLIAVMGASSVAQIFTTPPTEVGGAPEDLVEFLRGFDLTTRAGEIYATSDANPESAMEVMSPPGSENPELAAFRDAGGKLIVFHGNADGAFSAKHSADWYRKLDANNGDKAEDFALYYPVPAMAHCRGGATTENFDLFTALEDWVQNDVAPTAIVATTHPENEELPENLKDASRLLCPAPQVARYTGTDPKSADSFTCE